MKDVLDLLSQPGFPITYFSITKFVESIDQSGSNCFGNE
jgi:hypothetical protein